MNNNFILNACSSKFAFTSFWQTSDIPKRSAKYSFPLL